MVPEDQIRSIGAVLNNPTRPLKERFRALFTLKNLGGSAAVQCIEKCFSDESALLKHELAYCLGQMRSEEAIPILVSVLKDKRQEAMVRHEAGEALGAIGSLAVIPVLEEFVNDECEEVAETCQLAIDRIKWQQSRDSYCDKLSANPFDSVDPAPPASEEDISFLESVLLDEKKTLFDRYRAMFALRNLRTSDSALSIAKGLKAKSALFRHEVAFVLGQLQDPLTIDYLKENLADLSENEMVRHECAEALGSIATNSCVEALQQYLSDGKRVVRESCEVALDICDYANSPEFQYADTLSFV
ncbi:deoxyhypusine hydroxylase isoform X2 [Ischnura elegans]|uniref:deoxyhypusine hydroxylase isoform X2 n=1 Tax=Ischnura elegans TaxID=197161 RepID=UPI001ED8BD53|nr:deoxyhypusine hydroxylase isoform X2 [Ischnura elegans]